MQTSQTARTYTCFSNIYLIESTLGLGKRYGGTASPKKNF